MQETGMHWACRRKYIDILKLLYKSGVYVDTRDYAGRTPLFIATK